MFYKFMTKFKPASKVLVPATGAVLAAKYYYDIESQPAHTAPENSNALTNQTAQPAKRHNHSSNFTVMLDDWRDWAGTLFSSSLGYVYTNESAAQLRIEGSTLKLRWTYADCVYHQKVADYLKKTPGFVDTLDISLNGLAAKNRYALENIFGSVPLTIRTLDISSNGFGDVPGSILAAGLQANRAPLTKLALGGNDFYKYKGFDMALVLSAVPSTTEVLTLGSNKFDEMPIADLITGLSGLKFTVPYLDLQHNRLGWRSKDDLCTLVASFKAKHLNLAHNDLYKLRAADFAAMMANLSDEVEVLDLTFNGAVYEHFKHYTIEDWLQIVAAIKPTLKKIILHGNHLGLYLKSDEVLRLVEALGDKLEELDISYNSLHDSDNAYGPFSKSADFYIKLLKATNKFKAVKMDYFSMLEHYKPSPQNDALVLEMFRNLPKGETRLGYFWLNGQRLSKLPYKLLLQVIANAPAHITELNMQSAGYRMQDEHSSDQDGNTHFGYYRRANFTVEQWQELLSSAPDTIKEVCFYNCGFGKIFWTEDALAKILSALKPTVEHIGLGYNDLEISDKSILRLLKKAFAVLKPAVKSVDLRVNHFGAVPMADFIELLHAAPTTLETVYFPEDMQKYSNWSQDDLNKLFAAFPELNCGGAVALAWKRPKQLQLENTNKTVKPQLQ